MTPTTLIFWALSIGLSWAIFASFVPIDQWISNFLARRQKRLKELEERVASLERKINEKSAAV